MNNLEYVRNRFTGTSRPFSECANIVFSERNSIYPYSHGTIVDWLNQEYDSALEFPVGTLIQWNEDCFDCERESERRHGVYGVVKAVSEREGKLSVIEVATTDRRGRPMTKTIWVSASVIAKADIPSEIITIVRESFSNAAMFGSGNTIPK